MPDLCALVAAAGRGSRAGLPYPKTLFPLRGRPILLHILELLLPYDARPTIIVSPDGLALVKQSVSLAGRNAYYVVQQEPKGMGDAVLHLQESPAWNEYFHTLLIWGDIPFIQEETVAAMIDAHLAHGNDFTFPTRHVPSAYTLVTRDTRGHVTGLVETRELGISEPCAGERDIGVFIFRNDAVFPLLQEDLPNKRGHATGEHGFLYLVEHLARRGCRVEALPIATELDLVSLNSLGDVHDFL